MFTYGQEIPLDDVPPEASEMKQRTPLEPSPHVFAYGKEIFTEDDLT
ncbi:hypothetical protein [Ammoniphilus sp. CFH 90114]|nr:hypothetical protein [Ammoniphilus sp. CFH 90114]